MRKQSKKIKQKLDLILFDFHKTLSNSLFYTGIEEEYPEISKKLSNDIFSWGKNSKLIKEWMRGKYDYKKFNQIIAKEIKCEPEILNHHLERSVKNMSLNEDLINFAKEIKKEGVKIVIFTDNMDPFDKMVVPNFKLNEIFDYVISSWEYKILKEDEAGKLIDIVLQELKIEIKKTLLIDDSPRISKIIKRKGGHSYIYKNYYKEFPKFKNWFTDNFL